MSKHTPVPWVYDDNEGFSQWGVWAGMTPTGNGAPGPKIATVHGDSAEADANARLIAAAPELLEALIRLEAELVEDKYGDCYEPSPFENLALARAAIAKATGE